MFENNQKRFYEQIQNEGQGESEMPNGEESKMERNLRARNRA